LEKLYPYSHAAHTADALEEITDCAPDLLQGDVAPFASRGKGAAMRVKIVVA